MYVESFVKFALWNEYIKTSTKHMLRGSLYNEHSSHNLLKELNMANAIKLM